MKSIVSLSLAIIMFATPPIALAGITIKTNATTKGLVKQTSNQSANTRQSAEQQNTADKTEQQRFLLAVGINDYQDASIHSLQFCRKDARDVVAALSKHGNLDGVFMLTDQLATRANIERAFGQLKEASQPGDEIIIYWSGHTGTCADVSGDEVDGQDEFLVPFDAVINKINETCILDDVLSQWISSLQGRRVALIIDTVYAAGLLDQTVRGGQQIQQQQPVEQQPVQQKEALAPAVCGLFAAKETEQAHESLRTQGGVMTHLLVEVIEEYPTLTLAEAFKYLEFAVPKCMQEHMPGLQQTPVLLQGNSAFYLRGTAPKAKKTPSQTR